VSDWTVIRVLGIAAAGVLLCLPRVQAQIPTTLTDKIHGGSGSIDLLRDMSAGAFQQYLQANGGMLLGVDLNENAAGNESGDSVGVAIQQLELVIKTTAGTFSFSDFYTSTTAMIRQAGATAAREYYTMFGHVGSSQLTGGPSGADFARLDDVVRLRNVSFQGTLLSAQLNVKFLDTAKTRGEGNESFFDYSGGFEDFTLLGKQDAALLDAANIGVGTTPTGVMFTPGGPTVTSAEAAAMTPGAPAPPAGLLVLLGAVVAWKAKRHGAA
jgi:hypothetical protein